MGKHRVSYHVFGVSTRHTGALLAAAPTGFIGCTSSVLRLLRFPQFAVSRTAPANPASPSSHPAMLLCQDLITREKEDEEDHHQESPQAAAAQLSSDPSEIPNVQMLMQAADSCNRSVTLFGRRLMETWRNTTHRNNSANTATPAGGGGPQPSASSPLAVADHDDGGGLTEWLTRVQEEADSMRFLGTLLTLYEQPQSIEESSDGILRVHHNEFEDHHVARVALQPATRWAARGTGVLYVHNMTRSVHAQQ